MRLIPMFETFHSPCGVHTKTHTHTGPGCFLHKQWNETLQIKLEAFKDSKKKRQTLINKCSFIVWISEPRRENNVWGCSHVQFKSRLRTESICLPEAQNGEKRSDIKSHGCFTPTSSYSKIQTLSLLIC